MPISPPDKRHDLCDGVMQKIDSDVENTIREEGYCNNYRVVVRDNLSPNERDSICKEYLESGWKEVTSKTSAENGERPGLLMFTLTP